MRSTLLVMAGLSMCACSNRSPTGIGILDPFEGDLDAQAALDVTPAADASLLDAMTGQDACGDDFLLIDCSDAGAGCLAEPAGQLACIAMRSKLKATPAQAAITCLGALPSCVDAGPEIAACETSALAAVTCSDPSAETDCAQAFSQCKTADASVSACAQQITGLSLGGRVDFLRCMLTGDGQRHCAADDYRACIAP